MKDDNKPRWYVAIQTRIKDSLAKLPRRISIGSIPPARTRIEALREEIQQRQRLVRTPSDYDEDQQF